MVGLVGHPDRRFSEKRQERRAGALQKWVRKGEAAKRELEAREQIARGRRPSAASVETVAALAVDQGEATQRVTTNDERKREADAFLNENTNKDLDRVYRFGAEQKQPSGGENGNEHDGCDSDESGHGVANGGSGGV